MNKVVFAWHVHHDVLLEPLIEPLKNRIKYIKENKPKEEIELRLKLLKEVKGELPAELVEADQKYVEAWQEYVEAWQKYDEAVQKRDEARQEYVEAGQKYNEAVQKRDDAWDEYIKIYNKCESQILKLHKKECPNCSWDGETIFSKEVKDDKEN